MVEAWLALATLPEDQRPSLGLLLVVSMYGGGSSSSGTQLLYSDFKEKVAEGTIKSVEIANDRITGQTTSGETPAHRRG